jgi:hypothetical protein
MKGREEGRPEGGNKRRKEEGTRKCPSKKFKSVGRKMKGGSKEDEGKVGGSGVGWMYGILLMEGRNTKEGRGRKEGRKEGRKGEEEREMKEGRDEGRWEMKG